MIMDELSLDGKKCILAGASRGLGREMALALAEAGGDVAVVSRRLPLLDALAEEIRELGREAIAIEADLCKLPEIENMVGRVVEAFGRIDVLVYNAALILRMPSEDYTEDYWDRVMDVNLKGLFFCCQYVAREMIKRRRGKIITVSSIGCAVGIAQVPAYVASKGGVRLLTQTLGVEWSKYNINVNSIAPGYSRTELSEPLYKDERRREIIRSRIPMGRWGETRDFKGITVFLASDASDYITGQTIFVDGGWTSGFSWE